jgi:hypothetical protein
MKMFRMRLCCSGKFSRQHGPILCAVLVAAVWLGCATEIMAIAPTLRLDMTATYGVDFWQYTGYGIFFSTADDQLAMIMGSPTTDASTARYAWLSNDKGRTWRHWDAFDTWPKIAYSDVVRRGNELLAFGGSNMDGWNI